MGGTMDPSVLRELHDDLVRKYNRHAAAIECAWRSLDQKGRATCLKAGAIDGVVLKHPLDRSLGDAIIIPEWNLRDITEPGSDFLLGLLKHRATKSLFEQYCTGANCEPGDHAFIQKMNAKGYQHSQPFHNCYTLFMDGNQYGASYEVLSDHSDVLAAFEPAIRAGLCVPQSTGELILLRQFSLLQGLNIIVDDILDTRSEGRDRGSRPRKSDKAATAALTALSDQTPTARPTLPDLIASARDQQESLEEYLELLSTEPAVLAHAVNAWFFSRPELVADEKGRRLPVHTDKYISPAFFDAIHSAVKGAAVWGYICRLLELLRTTTTDKVYRAILLQEISNILYLEYERSRALFKRHVRARTGSKWFKRVSNAYDRAGNARVILKCNPEQLTRSDPQLHYMLRLCQSETNAANAVDWIKKLSGLHEAHPTERERLADLEAESLCDLAVIIGSIQDLSSVLPIPSVSRKTGQLFISKYQELDTELNRLGKNINLHDYVAPINNLLEPGMAESALNTLDHFVVEGTGTRMGSLYRDLIEDSISGLTIQYQQAKAKLEQTQAESVQPAISIPEPLDTRVERRREKEKTRPPRSSAFETTLRVEPPVVEEQTSPSQTFRVDSSTASVFSTLFEKSNSRGSVSWAAFELALVKLGFSILPKFGSVYTFLPPDTMAVRKSLTVHRPHKSRIEGYLIPIFARRLKRVYGWNKETFEVS
ncbi:hypothetical protein DTO282F9_4511 [Paecilomyces variotii]|nr:hypothetical protein DTO282F9_4511 [Paecilomyces variotii]